MEFAQDLKENDYPVHIMAQKILKFDIASDRIDPDEVHYFTTQVIGYLNFKTGARYRIEGRNKEWVERLLKAGRKKKDGVSIEQAMAVIDYLCDEWMGTKMEKYLQPATIFKVGINGRNFFDYLESARNYFRV